jgi:ATP-dependent protease ClpP protease subunit
MATITFFGEIGIENYEAFEQKMNESLEKEQDLTIYISTGGGAMCLSQNMVDLINNYPYYIEVIFSGFTYSAGMLLLTKIDYTLVDVNIMEGTEGMVHLADMSLSMRGFKDEDSYSSFAKKNGNIINESYLKNIKRFLTEKEMRVINKGKEVYLNHDRLAQIIETLSKEAENKLMEELADE